MKGFLSFFAILLLLGSCSGYKVPVPEGFASVPGSGVFRAVSPEGLTFRVKTVQHEPRMELGFWAEALQTHMSKEGYQLKGTAKGSTGPYPKAVGDGIFFEWVVPFANTSYTYLTALYASPSRIVVAECAGDSLVFRDHREAIMNALAELTIR